MSASEMQECHIPACLITNYRNYSYDANFMLVCASDWCEVWRILEHTVIDGN